MRISQLNGGDCRTYLVVSEKTREAVLVDPLLERTLDYLGLLEKEGLTLRYAVDTHTHADHLSGCADLMDRTGVEYVMGRGALPACPKRRMAHGETLAFGDARLDVLETPGHTTDSMTLVADGALLSGDFLFIGELGAGRLDLPGSDAGLHYESLKRLDGLADGTRLLPGHDYRGKTESTLGAERRLNPVLSPRSRDAYLEFWAAKKFGPAEWMKAVVKANRNCTLDPDSVVIPKTSGTCAAACAAVPVHDAASVPQIAPRDLSRLLSEKANAPLVLDVRSVEEYEGEGRIPGSKLIPLNQLSWRRDELPADRPVAVVCLTGARSTLAALALRTAGLDKVWVLTGGLNAWRQAGAGPLAG